jgi:hypothetical protein
LADGCAAAAADDSNDTALSPARFGDDWSFRIGALLFMLSLSLVALVLPSKSQPKLSSIKFSAAISKQSPTSSCLKQ